MKINKNTCSNDNSRKTCLFFLITFYVVANNLVNILASSLATAFLYNLFGASGIIYATIIMTTLIVIFAEVLPKIYSINRPNKTALFMAPVIFYLNKALYPLVFLIHNISPSFIVILRSAKLARL